MLWYPDFHQLMSSKETVGLKTVINNKLFNHKIDKFKIVEMGIIEEEQKKEPYWLCLTTALPLRKVDISPLSQAGYLKKI